MDFPLSRDLIEGQVKHIKGMENKAIKSRNWNSANFQLEIQLINKTVNEISDLAGDTDEYYLKSFFLLSFALTPWAEVRRTSAKGDAANRGSTSRARLIGATIGR